MRIKKYLVILGMLLYLVFSSTINAYAVPSTDRIAGLDRYKTAIEISKAGWQTADNVVLATGENFPDALCAAPLAKQLNGPVLLTGKDSLNSDTAEEIARLGAKKVYIIGGSGVISDNVLETIKSKKLECVRLWGENRYITALAVASYIKEQFKVSSEIAVAIGEDFPDALSISPIAAQKAMIMLLVPKDYLPDEINKFIKDNGFTKAYVVGGSDTISDSVTGQLPSAERIQGSDKYGRNLAVIYKFANSIKFDRVYIATGENYPDALAGSVLASVTSSPIILTNSYIEQDSLSLLKANLSAILSIVKEIKVLGGEGAVPSSILQILSESITSTSGQF